MIIGILQKATTAKTETEKGQEKEIVALAYNSALAKKVSNNDSTAVTADALNPELANQGATADGSNPITVTFTNSKRQYTINSSGTIEYAGIQSIDEPVASAYIYATVCIEGENETLLFSNNSKAIEDYLDNNGVELASGFSIENITGMEYFYNYDEKTDSESYNFPKWIGYDIENDWNSTEYAEKINKVIFLNTIVPQNTAYWFYGLNNLTTLENISNLNTSNVTDMNCMFSDCSSLTSLNLTSFDTSNVTDMYAMFYRCEKLTSLNVSNFNTSNVTNMSLMFIGCEKLTSLNVSSFDTTKVTDMTNMFAECLALTSLDLSNFNTSGVTNMESMFNDCPTLQTIYASNTFVTTNVTKSIDMFNVCTSLKGGNNTTYNSSYTDKTYAKIDTASTPGYFTSK